MASDLLSDSCVIEPENSHRQISLLKKEKAKNLLFAVILADLFAVWPKKLTEYLITFLHK